MRSRRLFIAASCALVAFRVTKAVPAPWRLEILKWFFELAITAWPVLAKVFDIGIREETNEDVRFKPCLSG